MSGIYDELPDESERPFFSWGEVPEKTVIRFEMEEDPIRGPEHPGETHDDAVSKYSVMEFNATVLEAAGDDVEDAEYRFALSSSRFCKGLGEVEAGAGDVIEASWSEDGEFRTYDVEKVE